MKYKKNIIIVMIVLGFAFSAFADGLIIVDHGYRIFPHPRPRPRPLPRPFPPPNFNPFPLEVKYHRVKVNIDDRMADTRVDQVFYNPTHRRLEGYYIFPIPQNAVIKSFSMYVNGKKMEAELLDAKKARRIYEDIVRKQRDPALLEYTGRGFFKVRIFPIEPRSNKRVKISYRQLLTKENNTVHYLYPLNTEKFSAKPLRDVSIDVTIKSAEVIKNIYCPTHETDIIRKGKKRARVSFEERNTKPDMDFKLYYSTDNKKLGFSLLSYKKKRDTKGFFLLSLSPGYLDSHQEVVEKDITFVMDTSGSMAGKKIRQAKRALLFCIENLNKGDRFEIIRFSTESEALFRSLSAVNEKNLEEARRFIDDLRPIGGTNIDEALQTALTMKKRKGRPYMIIFLTDGKPTIGETDENRLIKHIKNHNTSGTRIFTFGIGNDINTHLLDKVTRLTRAYRTYITPKEDIEVKVSNFYNNVQSPILTDIHLDFGSGIRVSKTYPRNLPDLFKGSSLTLLGRYNRSGDARIVLTGTVQGKEKTFTFNAADGFVTAGDNENDFIASLWAARRIGYLLDQIRLHGKDKELVDEVTQLARTYGIITPYTSYLIVEDEQDAVRRRRIRHDQQTLGNIVREQSRARREAEEDYKRMKRKSGSASVRASKEVQQMNMADNFAQTRPGKSRMRFTDSEGNMKNITDQVRNIQGRAVYNTGKFWVDSRVQQSKSWSSGAVQRIKFASDDYFKLIRNEPLAAQFMALGRNVRFILKRTSYEIHE